MNSKDYLIRYFQQLGEVLAAIAGFRDKKKHQLALDEINQTLNAWFMMSESDIEQLSTVELCEKVLSSPSPHFEKEKTIAELLYQKAITCYEMKKSAETQALFMKTLALYKAIDAQSREYSIEIQQRIAELDKLLSGAYSA